ncbi:hypothetical protein VTO73DRAFT_13046 [Trametes versicolor]
MSQTNSWDHADHAALVLEFLELTKPILQYWAIPTIAGLILKHGLDNETPLRKLLQDWNGIVKTLTDEQKTSLEAACPGIVARMTENLKHLEQVLSVASYTIKTRTYFGIVLPGTLASSRIKHAAQMFQSAKGDFERTSKHIWQDNPVQIATPEDDSVMVSHGINVEMGDIQAAAEHNHAALTTDAPADSSSAGAVRAPLPRMPEGVHLAYRSEAAALTAALLPTFLRQGRHGSSYNDGHPV